MHSLRLLLHLLPELLVERRPLSRPGHPAAGLSLADRQPRRGDRRTSRQSRGPVPPLSLPHHHELYPDLPQGAQSGEGHRRDQEDAGRAADLTLGSPYGLKGGPAHAGAAFFTVAATTPCPRPASVPFPPHWRRLPMV
ncbi:hypothetical protein KL86PLE_41348 [uncultured Pleomorphomonas sp.]|uniref:Uncharacterized protein n=1 Tax=uncultured Pleomorphomonas sp. TaxID=442121 RepID=A0A212LJ26_9HYPH|nr:hypothetical protein KL86PLE_41348 [uncultured Pleomorphomonas sp.]